jgi:hypothetical protein
LDSLTFVAKLAEISVWPAIVLFVLWRGRTRIVSLLDRLENFEGWGAKLAFGKQLDQVEQKLDRIEPLSTLVLAEPDQPPLSDLKARIAEAELPPPYVVQEAWKRVEHAIRSAFKKVVSEGEDVIRGDESIFLVASYLEDIKGFAFSKKESAAIIELHNLRNKAVHSVDPQITITDALRFSDLADRLVSIVEEQTADEKGRLARLLGDAVDRSGVR